MRINFFKFSVVFSAFLILLASCQKEEVFSETESVVPTQDVTDDCKLVSATKIGTVSAIKLTEELAPELKDSKNILQIKLLGKELIDLNISIYRIKYNSSTIIAGEKTPIVLAGNVAFIEDNSGNIKRHLESVTLYNTFFNTAKEDYSMGEEYSYYYLRAIYNALVIFPLYQGGDNEEENSLYVPCSEFIIKAKQAIDCELAALEFINKLENVEMMPGFYTENVGFSNGGGSALAFQYLLENDPEYSVFEKQINLLSTYVGSGNCSSKALIDNIMHIDSNSLMRYLSTAGYVPTVCGTYYTWGDKYFKGIDIKEYFSETLLNTRFEQYGNRNPVELYSENVASLLYLAGELPSINNTINSAMLNEDKTEIRTDSPQLIALSNAFDENQIICYDWVPRHHLRFVHSEDDDLISYEGNYQIWKNLSNNGLNSLVKFTKMTGKDHISATFQSIFNVLLCKHPYISTTIYDIGEVSLSN